MVSRAICRASRVEVGGHMGVAVPVAADPGAETDHRRQLARGEVEAVDLPEAPPPYPRTSAGSGVIRESG